MAFQSLKKCPKIDAILSHERAQWSGLVTSFGEPAVMNTAVKRLRMREFLSELSFELV